MKISADSRRKDRIVYLENIAHRALNDANYNELINISNQIIELDDDNAQAHFWLGFANHSLKSDYAVVERHYRNAIIADPKMSYAYSNLGMVVSTFEKRLKDAKDYFWKAIELDRNNVNAYYNLGSLMFDDGTNNNDIEECFRMVIYLSPNNADAYAALGSVLIRDKFRWKEAEECYLKAIQLDSSKPYAYEGLGYLYEKDQSRTREAEEIFLNAIERNPENAELYLRLAYIYHRHSKFDQTIVMCHKCALLGNKRFEPLLILASVYRTTGFEEESDKYVKLAEAIVKTKSFSANGSNYYNLACLYSILKNKNYAIKYLRKAIDHNADMKEIAFNDPDFSFIHKDQRFVKMVVS
jgi:tetratricopeptide (TPR) repeat protein